MSLPSAVFIREVGPREGFQTSSKIVPTAQKLQLISKLNETGVRSIEITSFVRPDRVPQMADAADVARQYERKNGIQYCALYLNDKGFQQAEASGRLDNRAWFYTAGSETFLKKNSNASQSQVSADVPKWIKLFNAAGKKPHGLMVSTAFACSYEGVVSLEKLLAAISGVCDPARSGGFPINEICLADTVGWASPEQVKKYTGAVQDRWPESEVSLHLHDTRGLGIANAYAGLQMGVKTFDSSVGGVGGCPFSPGAAGNIATEELVYLCEEVGVPTGIDIGRMVEAARLAETIMGHPLPGTLYRGWRAKGAGT